MKRSIRSIDFTDAQHLGEVLETLTDYARTYEYSTSLPGQFVDPSSVVNVVIGGLPEFKNHQPTKATLEVETLTDRSRVYNVILS